MAYGEKYYHEFCNPFGQVCRISILKKDYEGGSIELEGQEEPIKILYDNSDEFKFKAIIPSSAEIGLTFGTGNGIDFEEFWDSDEKTFKVEYYVGGAIDWIGYVLIEDFSYNLTGGVYYAQIKAVDGLSTLESIIFKDENTNRPYGLEDLTYNDGYNFPFILIATEILRKLDLNIDLWTLVDIYEQNQTDRTSDSRNSDPLAITQVNVKTYINETDRKDIAFFEDVNEAWNCKKVMENLLNIWGCNLYQEKGVWRIKNFNVSSKYGVQNQIEVEPNIYIQKSSFTDGTDQGIITDIKKYVYDEALNLYSDVSILLVGSDVENVIGTNIAKSGFYKLKGIGEIIRVSANKVAEIIPYTLPVYDWHKYNTLSGYVGKEPINDTVLIPCNDSSKVLIGNDHLLRMDDIYKQFRVNYEYSYLKDGDSPVNLIKNGNFEQGYTQYGGFESPPNWYRVKWGDSAWYDRLRVDTIPPPERSAAGGGTKALTMFKQFNNLNTSGKARWARTSRALGQNNIVIKNTVDNNKLTIRIKYRFRKDSQNFYPMFRFFLAGSEKCGFLVNDYLGDFDSEWRYEFKKKLISNVNGHVELGAKTVSSSYLDNKDYIEFKYYKEYDFLYLNAEKSIGYDKDTNDDEETKWYHFELTVPPFPDSGTLCVYIYGLGTNKIYRIQDKPFKTQGYGNNIKSNYPTGEYNDFQISNINLGAIPTDGEEVPSEDYIYANENVNFSDQRDPIEIFNGDTEDIVVQSSLIVPENTSKTKNKWDTSNNDFGKSDLGLILCKSIMSQYGKPSRLLEGSVKSDNVGFGTRFEFEAIPNVQWILLRGSFNHIRGYIEDATFAQISGDAIKKGGIINGESLDPDWQTTDNVRCVQDNGENTGYYEQEEEDINRNSETFGGFRWVVKDIDNALCPIGLPSKYYWGTDDVSYQLSNFKDYNILLDEDEVVTVSYTQEGGEYIYFLHLASLGTVNRVSNPYQYNIVNSFQYLSDITINGYLYRVLRQDFKTAAMNEFTQTFDFN